MSSSEKFLKRCSDANGIKSEWLWSWCTISVNYCSGVCPCACVCVCVCLSVNFAKLLIRSWCKLLEISVMMNAKSESLTKTAILVFLTLHLPVWEISIRHVGESISISR